jgi:hypothetical protein
MDMVYDIMGYHLTRVSEAAMFLPTDLPENRVRVLKKRADLQALAPGSTDIYLDDKSTKYLKRPRSNHPPPGHDVDPMIDEPAHSAATTVSVGQEEMGGPHHDVNNPDFENMSYLDFMTNYVQVYGAQAQAQGGARPVFVSTDGRAHWRTRRSPILYWTRPTNTANAEDAFLHLLMLHRPTRRDVPDWINHHDNEVNKFMNMAMAFFTMDQLRNFAPALATMVEGHLEELQQQQPGFGSVSIETLCEAAPRLGNLTADQRRLVQEIFASYGHDLESCRILVMGPAGSGKSTVLRYFMRYAFTHGMEPILLAPSGVAANNIQGHTIHRFFSIARAEGSHDQPECDALRLAIRLQHIQLNNERRPCFLIDECSMVSSYLLEVVSNALRQALGNNEPYGGCPILFFGDFGQLGPVVRQGPIPFMWKAKTNDYLDLERFELTEPARQAEDFVFSQFLSLVRVYDDDDLHQRRILNKFLWAHRFDGSRDQASDYFFLFSRTKNAREWNERRLARLPGPMHTFDAVDGLGAHSTEKQQRLTEMQTGLPTRLNLKVGCRVMCLSNIFYEGGIVNGALGTVQSVHVGQHGLRDSVVQVGFDAGGVVDISVENRSVLGKTYSRTQLPLTLAWASTIHKSQSLTLARICVSIEDHFCSGLLYVALSRVRSHQDVRIIGLGTRERDLRKSRSFAHVPEEVRLHIDAAEEAEWNAGEQQYLPVGMQDLENQGEVDDDVAGEYFADPEDGDDYFADHDEEDWIDGDELEDEDEMWDDDDDDAGSEGEWWEGE